MYYSFFRNVSVLGLGMTFIVSLVLFLLKGWAWASGTMVAGLWVFLNSYFLYQLLEISVHPKPGQNQKILLLSIVKFPVLYLIGFFILRTRVFPVYGVLTGLTLYFAAILAVWARFNLGPRAKENDGVREAPMTMTAPIIIIALACIVFGLYNALPVNTWIQPVLGDVRLAGASFGGLHVNPLLGGISVAVLIAALLNHIYGVRRTGKGLGAVDHIYYAPVAHTLYDTAEAGRFDPYNAGLGTVNIVARIAWAIDRGTDFIYDCIAVKFTEGVSTALSVVHNGSHARYILWALAGLVLVVVYLVRY